MFLGFRKGVNHGDWKAFQMREEQVCLAEAIGLVLLERRWKWARARFGRGVLKPVFLPGEWLNRDLGLSPAA